VRTWCRRYNSSSGWLLIVDCSVFFVGCQCVVNFTRFLLVIFSKFKFQITVS
jgi:hypothetical protein